jgi:hypothetical protein
MLFLALDIDKCKTKEGLITNFTKRVRNESLERETYALSILRNEEFRGC